MDSKHYLPPRGQCGVRLRRRRPGGEGEEEKAGVQPTSSVTDVERLNLGLPCGMLGGASGEKTEKQMERNGDDRLGPSHRQITDTGSQYRVQPTRISTPNETDQEHECAKKKNIDRAEAVLSGSVTGQNPHVGKFFIFGDARAAGKTGTDVFDAVLTTPRNRVAEIAGKAGSQ